MASIIQLCGDFAGTPIAANHFTSIASGNILNDLSSEADAQSLVRTTGTFSQFSCRWATNTGAIVTIHFRVNSANGNEVLSVPTNTTGDFIDSVNTDAPTAGQTVDCQYSATISPGEASIISVVFTATSGTVGRLGANSAVNIISTASATQFLPLCGLGSFDSTEANVQLPFGNACTLQNLMISCTSKARSKADTVTLRKNAVAGSETVSITGTGTFEDTTHTDAVVAGDKVAIGVTTGSGTGGDNFNLWGIEQSSSDSTWHYFDANPGGQQYNAGAASFFLAIGGTVVSAGTTEFDAAASLQLGGVISDLSVLVATNSSNGSTVFTFRNNGANTSLTASVTAGATGLFSDSTHSVSVAIGDDVNYSIAPNGSSGTVILAGISLLQGPLTQTAGEMVASAMFGFIQPFSLRTQIVAY